MAKKARQVEHSQIGIGEDVPNRTSFEPFQKNVTTSGTPEQLHASLEIPDGFGLVIKAKHTNAGLIKIGKTSSAFGTACFQLQAGQSISLRVTNANLVYLDCTANGEGVECIVET